MICNIPLKVAKILNFNMNLKEKMNIDKQLSMSLNCKHLETKTKEVLRSDMEGEASYLQLVEVCLKCNKEL